MRRGERLPPVWLGPGAVDDPAALARFADLRGVPVGVGPVVVPQARTPWDGPALRAVGVGGVEHVDAPGRTVRDAAGLLSWCTTHDLLACVAVRGRSTGELAEVVSGLRGALDADRVAAVEVDLRHADDQLAMRSMARVREVAPRDHLLLARLSALQPDLVGTARGAVAGGAGAVVVSGQVPIGDGRWWSGPSTAAVTRAGLAELTVGAQERRWPGVPLVAAGGVHDAASAWAAREAGASAVQLGTALWADTTVLHRVRDALTAAGPPRTHHARDHAPDPRS